MKADLHIHSCFSDGRYSPSKIIEYAAYNDLEIISLTDHDTIGGLQEAESAVAQAQSSVQLISGVELSTCLNGEELHILGYGIHAHAPMMADVLQRAQKKRTQRVGRILDTLRKFDIHVSIHDVRNGHRAQSLGRMHIARFLMRQGRVRTIREAFDRYLSYDPQIIEYAPTEFVSSEEAIAAILDAGGIPVFAHPTIALFDRYLETLIGFGLQGVEVFKGSRTAIEEFYLETVVKDKGLLITGGSDWHGNQTSRNLGSFYVDSAKIQPFLQAVATS